MMAIWMIAAALSAAPDESDSAQTARAAQSTSPSAPAVEAASVLLDEPTVPPRTGNAFSEAVRKALRRARSDDQTATLSAARELMALFREVQGDASLGPGAGRTLQSQLRTRLLALADQIDRRAAGLRRHARVSQVKPIAQRPVAARVAGDRGAVLGQQAAPGGGSGGGPASDDHGEALAQLIREVVAPPSWDTAGGSGTSRYWRPGRALIIRQTNEVHDDVAGLLEQLERMGR